MIIYVQFVLDGNDTPNLLVGCLKIIIHFKENYTFSELFVFAVEHLQHVIKYLKPLA